MSWADNSIRCHVFDLDHTLVTNSSSYVFCRFLCRQGILPRRVLLRAYLAQIQWKGLRKSLQHIHNELFAKILRGLEMAKLEKASEQFIDEFIWSSLYPPVFALFKREQHLGSTVALMSSSPSFLVERIAKRLGADHWEATEYEVDKMGRLSAVKRFLDGEAKAEQVAKFLARKGYTKNDCKAYSDSYHDLPFLLAAGHPVAVNPDRKLRSYAMKHEWEIL